MEDQDASDQGTCVIILAIKLYDPLHICINSTGAAA